MLWMIIIIAVVLFFVLRSRSNSGYQDGYGSGFGSMGGMGMFAGGMLLGYLLSNHLINQSQYDAWQNMNGDELRQTLLDNNIVSAAEFDSLAQQFTPEDGVGADDSYDSPDYSDYNDGGGSDDSFFDGGSDDF